MFQRCQMTNLNIIHGINGKEISVSWKRVSMLTSHNAFGLHNYICGNNRSVLIQCKIRKQTQMYLVPPFTITYTSTQTHTHSSPGLCGERAEQTVKNLELHYDWLGECWTLKAVTPQTWEQINHQSGGKVKRPGTKMKKSHWEEQHLCLHWEIEETQGCGSLLKNGENWAWENL